MAILTRYETFEELKADRPVISTDLLAQKLETEEQNEFEIFIELLKKAVKTKNVSNNISFKNGE